MYIMFGILTVLYFVSGSLGMYTTLVVSDSVCIM